MFSGIVIYILVLFVLSTNTVHSQNTPEDYFATGLELYEAAEYDNAYENFAVALDLFTDAGNTQGEADTHYYMGLVKYSQGVLSGIEERFVEARDWHFNPAYNRYTTLAPIDQLGAAQSRRYIALCHTALGNYDTASQLYGEAVRQAQNGGDNFLAAHILIDKADNLGALSWQRRSNDNLANQSNAYVIEQVNLAERHLDQAISDYTNAMQLFSSLVETSAYAETQVKRGNAYYRRYDVDNAIFDLAQASDTFASLDNPQSQAETLLLLAEVHHYSGDPENALATLEIAETNFSSIGDEIGYNRARSLRGYIGYQEGFADVLALMDEVLIAQRSLGDNDG